YWLPVHVLSEIGTKSVLRAFCDVFDDCSLWHGSGAQLMVVGTRRAPGALPEVRFQQQWRTPSVAIVIPRLGLEMPQLLGALFIGDAPVLNALAGDAPPVTDNDPRRINAPSVSDSAAEKLSAALSDTSASAARFAASPFIKRLWPGRLLAESLPFFAVQGIIN